MGEIAEMMLDGTLCEGCGEFLDRGSPGFAQYCGGCRPAASQAHGSLRYQQNVEARARKTEACPECGKRFRKAIAVEDHRRAVHGAA
jgi:hypothetical protein